MVLLDIKTSTITSKGQIAIPREIRQIGGFKEGQKIAVLAFQNKIELGQLKQIDDKLFTTLASQKSLSKDWLRREDEIAWKNL